MSYILLYVKQKAFDHRESQTSKHIDSFGGSIVNNFSEMGNQSGW